MIGYVTVLLVLFTFQSVSNLGKKPLGLVNRSLNRGYLILSVYELDDGLVRSMG